MKKMALTTYWSPAEAHSMLLLLDELREVIVQNYAEDITTYCKELHGEQRCPFPEIEDDGIPF
jgi:hypothetical protein